MQKRKLSKNEQGIIGILLVIAFIVNLVFLRDILVKRGVSILMLTRQDYMNAVEYYMQKKYGEKFEGEYVYEDSVYVHPKSKPEWHVVVDFESEGGMTSFHDNYVGYLKKEELEKYIYELVKPIYGECKVYIEPHGFALDDSWNKDTNIRIYASKGDYNTNIFTNDNIKDMDTKFESICQIFVDNKLESNVILVTYITDTDLRGFQEKYVDMVNNRRSFLYRIDAVYDNVEKRFIDIDILKGNEDYAN
ncbi:hypothetical protein HMPREF9970_1854 [Lachnoanaerobaculum saburreum F0468]|uniref:Uncharacterized protein n=1 Tax=Lachnoanaerobaculum saburreum F0468 TaxID=1095750 RepID=I0R406_9FIRM|nr:hypothetical protein [Lachnoanaerobaculum saburreum]EIC94414.1 hypothetical protein HMPREF9970_1854 [Lachnoanaerobaculum saburreum F0468]